MRPCSSPCAVSYTHLDVYKRQADLIKKNGKEASRVYFHPGDMTHTNEYGSFLFAHFIAKELSKLDPLTFAIDVQDEEDFTPDEHTAILTGTSTAAGNQDEQKEDVYKRQIKD